MSYSGFWLRGAKGKFAGAVLQKGEKGTIQRELVVPKNPRTNAQMAHRIIFATVTQAAARLYPFIKDSFEGFEVGAKSRREFVRLNTKRLRALAAIDYENQTDGTSSNCFVTTKGVSALIPNQYVISKGTLQYEGSVVVVRYDGDDSIGLNTVHDFRLPMTVEANTRVMVSSGDLLKALFGIENLNEEFCYVGIYGSDNLIYGDENSAAGLQINETNFDARRLVPKSLNTSIQIGTISGDDVTIDETLVKNALRSVLDMAKSDAHLVEKFAYLISNLTYTKVESELFVSPDAGAYTRIESSVTGETWALAAAVLKSSIDGNVKKRSTATMLTAIPYGGADAFQMFGLYYNYGLTAWFKGDGEITDNDRFLNQGGTDNVL